MTRELLTPLSDFDFDLEGTALLVIDLQNDFCKPEGFFSRLGFDVSRVDAVIGRVRALLDDVRPLGLPVYWTTSVNPDPPLHRLPPFRFREERGATSVGRALDQFDPASWGTQIVDELIPAPEDVVIRKPRYTAFYQTELEESLRARGIDTLVICGVTTNCCVDTTARDAFVRGFDVCVLADCVAAFAHEWDLHDASLRNLSLLFAVISTSDDFVAAAREAAQVTA